MVACPPAAIDSVCAELAASGDYELLRVGGPDAEPGDVAAIVAEMLDGVAAESPFDELTPRELEVLKLIASGATNVEVAARLWVTRQTVKFHLRNVYRKLDVANRTQASHLAHTHGLLAAAA